MWDRVQEEGTDLGRPTPAQDGHGGGGKLGVLQVLREHSRGHVRSGEASPKRNVDLG